MSISDAALRKRLRDAAGDASYRVIADACGMNHETVRRQLTDGSPSIQMICGVAEMSGQCISWLLCGKRTPARREILESCSILELATVLGEKLDGLQRTVNELATRAGIETPLDSLGSVKERGDPALSKNRAS